MAQFTHFDEAGQAHMVNVGEKPATQRTAVAEGVIRMQADTLRLIQEGGHKKGDVLSVARIAGIMASKKTADLIPLCHPLMLTHVGIDLTPTTEPLGIHCRATVSTEGQTGVEMEALTAVQIALLTIYDMCKAVDRGMTLTDIGLVMKSGGRSGAWQR
ncbi:MAG TPA: cyclic pyranopterin monophosphate synthase MoaC [Methylococcaceae bacterium]|jgi:cyclic pyranopterin phosphate synthase|nr:cyclic pyranopterin monophosphate synthase MoaC [Methylococcaceae bacterium]